MWTNASVLVIANILMLTGITLGQDAARADDGGTTSIAELLRTADISDFVQIASELRKAGESINSFGESLKDVATVTSEAAGSTSQNLAAIGGEFDPFGFKTAFQTIQQQNAIIHAQNQIIMELQQKEIRHLRKENNSAKRPKRPSRRRKSSETQKRSDKSQHPK